MTKADAKRITLEMLRPNLGCLPIPHHERRMEKARRFVMALWTHIRNLRSLHIRWAYGTLSRAMQKDPSYAQVWHANIAMPIYDASGGRIEPATANRLATVLMRHLFAANHNTYEH